MRPTPPNDDLMRHAQFEKLEEILALSVTPLPDFYIDDSAQETSTDIIGDIQKSLADVNDIYGTTYAHNQYGFTGKGQTVAVIDSGIAWDHESLGGGYGSDYRVVGGWDFTEENDANPYDDGPGGFHGTHVAGIIGSDDQNHTGVAPGVDLVGLRVFNDQGAGYFSWVENALGWIHTNKDAFENPITAVNLSLGTNWNADSIPNWAMLEDEFAQLEADGIFISVAAGNQFSSYNTAGLSYPAVSPYVVPVASVDNDGNFSSFSQRNDRVIAAPGQSITSTVPDYVGNFNGKADDYGTASGTSMAAPYLAGASVLIRQAMEFNGFTNITQDMIYDHLRETGDSFYDSVTGANYSRLNLQKSLDALMPEDDFGSLAESAHSLGTMIDSMEVSGVIGELNDADYFTFTAGATGKIAIEVSESYDLDSEWTLAGGGGSMEEGSFVFNVIQGQTYTIGLNSAEGIGYYTLDMNLTPSMIHLGAIQDLLLNDQAISGETWYQVEATREGLLTLQAKFSHAAGDIDLEVYDANMNLIAKSASDSNTERLDIDVQEGEDLYVRIIGSNSDVDLRAANLVQVIGSTATVHGTAGDDVIHFSADSATHQLTINDLEYSFDANDVTAINIEGDAGEDSVTLKGTAGKEKAYLRNGFTEMIGSDYVVSVSDAENVKVISGGGRDRAYVYDSAGDDHFVARPTDASMTGEGYASHVEGFSRVYAYASGGDDKASLYDSEGNDRYVAKSAYASLSGRGFFNYARGFEQVYAYASEGNDKAKMYDSLGDDLYVAHAAYAYLEGEGFYNYAGGFDRVYAYASGGHDKANMYDSLGDDKFVAKPTYAYIAGQGFYIYAKGFEQVFAYASEGEDRAKLYDSNGDDLYTAHSTYAFLSGEDFYNYASGFDQVKAFASGGQDKARMYDSQGDDTFQSKTARSQMQGEGFSNKANNFEQVYAYASAGIDQAVFRGLGNAHSISGKGNQVIVVDLQESSDIHGYGFEKVAASAKKNEAAEADLNAIDFLFKKIGLWD